MEPGLNQGRQRELERRRWIPEYSGGGLRNRDFADEGDVSGEAMLRFLVWEGGCDCKMEVLYVLQVVLSPSLLGRHPKKGGSEDAILADGGVQKNVHKLIFYKDGSLPQVSGKPSWPP